MDIFNREIPPIRSVNKVIEATTYNRVKLALLRLGDPLQFTLTKLPLVDTYITPHRWVCFDATQDQVQLLEWTDFQIKNRGLHEDVPCTLHLYHVHSGLIMAKALEDIVKTLNQLLKDQGAYQASRQNNC